MTAAHSGAARTGSRRKSTLGFLNVAAGAATEIKALIRKSSEEVVDLVNAAGDSLEEIATHVAGITERIGVIADVAKAQATSLHEVSSSISRMDQIREEHLRHPPPRHGYLRAFGSGAPVQAGIGWQRAARRRRRRLAGRLAGAADDRVDRQGVRARLTQGQPKGATEGGNRRDRRALHAAGGLRRACGCGGIRANPPHRSSRMDHAGPNTLKSIWN